MADDVKALLDRICGMISERIDRDRIATAKRRQAAAFAQDAGEWLPMSLGKSAPQVKELPSFDWRQQWHDPAKSLYMQLKNVVGGVAGPGDNVPGVRSDTGVINCMTIFGAGFDVPPHTKPIVTRYVPKEALVDFEVPQDISSLGIMPRVIEHMEHHKAVLAAAGLGDAISVYHCDQQGPFDVAAQTRGHEMFTDMYEDPGFAHELMRKSTDAYIAVSKLCKKINGEPLTSGNAVGYWIENGGVRMCGDSDILIGPELFRQFVQPYQQRAFQAFGGGWLHYCGGARGYGRCEGLHLHELYAGIDGLRGLNWSTAGDWLGQMRRLRALGVVHVGGLPREEGETLEQYFRRALGVYDERKGLIFHPEVKAGEHDRAMELWHELQDERFN